MSDADLLILSIVPTFETTIIAVLIEFNVVDNWFFIIDILLYALFIFNSFSIPSTAATIMPKVWL